LYFVSLCVSLVSPECCKEKKVGDDTYTLIESEGSTSSFGCKDGCVYNKVGEPPAATFCMKFGSSKVTCLDGQSWCYTGYCGPSNWGDTFPDCNGMSQSPIDIVTTGVTPITEETPLSFNKYDEIRGDMFLFANTVEHNFEFNKDRLENGTLGNNGHTAQLDVIGPLGEGVGVLRGGPLGGDYQMLQLHFHWGADDTKGSEHTLDGERFPLELHIVHTKVGEPDFLNVPDGLAVTGFFFEVDSTDNPAIEPLVSALTNIIKAKETFDMSGSEFMITDLIRGVAPLPGDQTTEYTTYKGSLTTPTCNEVVHWINFITPLKISSAQLDMFRDLQDKVEQDIVDNFRPPQPLNGRTVTLYGP